MEVVIATSNAGKVREFREMLDDGRFTWRGLVEFPDAPVVEETGHTFRANAMLKASGYALATQRWALADDSGLEVEALRGAPGVFSARWAELHQAGRGDAANNALLLEQMRDVPDTARTARFVCVLVLADPSGRIVLSTRDTVAGRILRGPVGANGFGYDPLFWIDELGETTAQLPPDAKHRISHRGKALRRIKMLLDRI